LIGGKAPGWYGRDRGSIPLGIAISEGLWEERRAWGPSTRHWQRERPLSPNLPLVLKKISNAMVLKNTLFFCRF
jgi:hypothetical protein